MAKCKRCNVTISDNTNICPLCHCALEGGQIEAIADQYPRVHLQERIMKRVSNIILAVVLIASVILELVNAIASSNSSWCIIPVASMVYGCLIFKIAFVSSKGYRMKIVQAVGYTLMLLLIIDLTTGYHGWAFNYVLPSSVIITDVIIIILMLANHKEWQSYLIMEIAAIGFSLLPLILWIVGVITNPILTFVAIGVAIIAFLVVLIIGDGVARGELKRRFHIR